MIIRFDYDNDVLVLGHEKDFGLNDKKLIKFPERDLKKFLPVITELCNLLASEHEELRPSIRLEKQDEGEVTIIEEY